MTLRTEHLIAAKRSVDEYLALGTIFGIFRNGLDGGYVFRFARMILVLDNMTFGAHGSATRDTIEQRVQKMAAFGTLDYNCMYVSFCFGFLLQARRPELVFSGNIHDFLFDTFDIFGDVVEVPRWPWCHAMAYVVDSSLKFKVSFLQFVQID
jgi:hypothetical protein